MLRALTFGQCVFETPVARIAPDSEVHFALLLSIVSAPADGVGRDEVVARLWPRAAGEDGRHCLRQAMYRLRQLGVPAQLSAGRIVLHGTRSALDVHCLLYDTPPHAELVRLGAMAFLPSYHPSLGESFAQWLETLRERVSMHLCRALADEVASARSRGRFHDMGKVARALLVLDPLNELATMVLAESLALQGSKVEALRLLEEYEVEVGSVNRNLQLPARVLRRRVAEVLDDGLQLRQLEVPFVGREREFGALQTLWRDVRGGQARAVIVSGEAGIGKSRLAGELVRLASLDGGRVARYTTSAGDTFTPLSTLVSVGQQLLTLPGALGCAADQLSYVRRLGTPESVSAWSVAGMAADVLYAQLVHAFAELVSAIAEEAPLIIFVDDAERLHPTTWRVLVDIWDRVGRRGVFFLLAARRLPSWFGSLGTRSCERLTQHLPIAAFSSAESQQFVQTWSAQHGTIVSDATTARLASTSGGNPFYLTELAAHVGRGGDPEQTPSTILDLIGAQCRVLSKGAHRVLVVITVLESRATTTRVTQVLEQPASDFMAALHELQEAGLVTTQGPAVRVRHRMVEEVALSLAMPSVVDFAHGRAAAVLESEADATLSVELLGDCVTHWERAGETRRAYEAAMKLGYRLVGVGMGEEAEQAFVRAERIARSDNAKAAALEGTLISYRISGKWYAMRAAYEALTRVRSCISSTASATDEYSLLALESSIWANDLRTDISFAMGLAIDRSRARDLRLKAAALCAMYADNFYDEASLLSAFESVRDLHARKSDDSESATLELIYHCSVGSIEEVATIAQRLATLASTSDKYWVRIQGQRRAAIGHMRAGSLLAAEKLLIEVLSLSEKLRLPHQSIATLELLVDTSLAQGALKCAHEYLNALARISLDVGTEYVEIMRKAASMRVAWALRDKELVTDIDSGAFVSHHTAIPILEHQLLAHEVALTTLRGDKDPEADLLPRLIRFHLRSRSMGRQDFSSEVLFTHLRFCGDFKSASEFEADYFSKYRRERNEPLHRLGGTRMESPRIRRGAIGRSAQEGQPSAKRPDP